MTSGDDWLLTIEFEQWAFGYFLHMADTRFDDRSLGDLTKQLSRDVSSLVRSEVALARAEVSERAGTLGKGVGLVGAAALFGLIAVSCIVAAAVAALALVVATWLAALIVAAVALVVAAILAKIGRSALKSAGPPIPSNTVESAKEDVAWVRTQAKSGAR